MKYILFFVFVLSCSARGGYSLCEVDAKFLLKNKSPIESIVIEEKESEYVVKASIVRDKNYPNAVDLEFVVKNGKNEIFNIKSIGKFDVCFYIKKHDIKNIYCILKVNDNFPDTGCVYDIDIMNFIKRYKGKGK